MKITMRNRPATISAAMIVVMLAACSPAPPPATRTEPAAPAKPALTEGFGAAWAMDPMWDDGQAEVALYEAKRPQYGKIESYESVFIVVKEDFNPQLYVKADAPYDGKRLLPVLKLNAVHSYWTDRYPYHYLLSVFVRRSDPASLVKLALGSQEWCGATFKMVKTWGGRPELLYHTYWDGEGDAARPLDLRPGDLLEDQMPLSLRSLKFAPGLELRRRILPSLISNNLHGYGGFTDATLHVAGEEEIRTPAGRFAAWKLEVKFGEVQQTWWFEKAETHILLRMDSSDGRTWLLKSRTRKPYWTEPTFRPAM